MKIVFCKNHHSYDADQSPNCPVCGAEQSNREPQTASLSCPDGGEPDTITQAATLKGHQEVTVLLSQTQNADEGAAPTAEPGNETEQTVLLQNGYDEEATVSLASNTITSSSISYPVVDTQLAPEVRDPAEVKKADGRCMKCMEDRNGHPICPYCGFPDTHQPQELCQLAPHTLLAGRYVIGMSIGMGGFGITYHAWDTLLKTQVAIKEYFQIGLVNRAPGTTEVIVYRGDKAVLFQEGLDRFLLEARSMAQFGKHPNIVNVIDFFEANHTGYIVMEYLDGVSIRDYLKEIGGKLPPPMALELLMPVLSALESIHENGLIHRDISPDNIFKLKNGTIKVIDFGAARLSGGPEERTRSILLKPGYAPPEQYRDKSVQGPFTDIYALGATLYRILTGVVPEESIDRAKQDELQPPSAFNVAVSKRLDNIVLKAMAINPDYRFRTIKEMRSALENETSVDLPEEEIRRTKKKRRFAIIAAACALLVAGIFTGSVLWRRAENPSMSLVSMLEDDELEIWVPQEAAKGTDGESSALLAAVQLAGERVQGTFRDEGKDLKITITLVPEDELPQRLESAAASGKMPDLFCCDKVSDAVVGNTYPLTELYNSFRGNSYIFSSNYLSLFPEMKQMPVSCEIPMVFTNTTMLSDYSIQLPPQDLRGNYDDFVAQMSVLGTKPAVSPEITTAVLLARGFPVVDFKTGAVDYNDDAMQAAQQIEADYKALVGHDPENIYRLLEENQLAAYLGSCPDFFQVRKAIPGRFALSPLPGNGDYLASFFDTWYIGTQKENRQQCAMWFLSAMLSDEVQNMLHIQKQRGIPVNNTTMDTYFEVYSELSFLRDYLNRASFAGNFQGKLLEYSR